MIKIYNILELEKHISGLKAVIFDLDDTLYSEREYVKSGFAAVAEVLSNVENAEQKLWTLFTDGKAAVDELLTSEGIFSEHLKAACLKAYRNHTPKISLYVGVKDMLIRLRESGYKIGIITDGRPQGQRAKVDALGLSELVDEIIVTDELGGEEYRKPCEKAFRIMTERLGVTPSECSYVGDNINKDFIAPINLGMRAILFKNREGLYFTES